jgi:tetratricopeptide (TPR) repeat protein
MMRKFSSHWAVVALVVVLGLSTAACGQVGLLQAKLAFRDANSMYQRKEYPGAAAKYEEAINECRGSEGDCTAPDLTPAYFFLANSYDQQYRPARRGEAANDALLTKAIDFYKKSVQVETNPQYKQLSLQYLVNAYGTDKLNDPSQAEPVLLSMIEVDPKDTTPYFGLANIYEQSGDYERAEQMLIKAREVRSSEPSVYMQLAGFYNRQGEFAKTMDALHERAKVEPTNPEAFYTIGTYYYEKAFRDFTIPEKEATQYIQQGLEAIDKALELRPDYFEAITYRGLLIRVQARIEKNPARQQELLKQAKDLENQAIEVRNKQRAAAGE